MSEARTCPECGRVLPRDAPKGFCPDCLVRLGMGWSAAGSEATGPPAAQGLAQYAELPIVFGGYELMLEIGRGGMGLVYKARQVAANRLVALKMLLHGRFSDPAFIERFHLEAEAAAHLDHPNIVSIYEVGQQAGQPFYSMRLIEGRSLAQANAECGTRGAEWLRRCADLVATIARAVQYAHERGVLHRDLKPHNILLDAQGKPYLTDFGLAKLLGQETGLTVSAGLIGSPEFMAPEQAAGNTRQLTTAADVYGLGAVLYALITGKAVFHADTPLETVRRVLEREPVRPQALNPAVDRDLETICLKCLQKEPARRYASAHALAEDLECWLRSEPIEARPATEFERVWLWCKRQPLRAGLVGALALTLISGLAGVAWQWKRATTGELRARQNVYAADMLLAQHAIQDNTVGLALRLLNKHRPLTVRKSEMDLRAWEWRYLWRLCQPDESVQLQMQSTPSGPAFLSQDGRVMAVRTGRDNVEVWDLAVKQQKARLSGFASSAILGLSADGSLLAVRRGKATLEVWNLNSGTLSATLDHPLLPKVFAFSPNGSLLATFAYNSTNTILSVVDWAANRTLTNFSAPPVRHYSSGAVAFSPDGSRLAIGEDFGTIRLLDWRTGRHVTITNLGAMGEGVMALAFSPAGDLLASASGYTEGTIRLWDAHSGAFRRQLTHAIPPVTSLAFTRDSQELASASIDRTIRIWRVADLAELRCFAGHNGEGSALAFLPDGATLASGCKVGTVCFWKLVASNRFPAHTSLAISAGFGSSAQLEPQNFVPGVLAPETVRRLGFAFAPDGQSLITTDREGCLRVWDVNTMQPTERLSQLGSNHWGVALSLDGRWLATGEDAGKISIWDWPARRRVTGFEFHFEWFGFMRFCDSGRFLLATATLNNHSGRLRIWRTNDWQELTLAAEQTAGLMTASLAPDDRLLAIGYSNGSIKLWSFPDGRLEAAFTNHQGYVCAVPFSPDGGVLASAGSDGNVKLWDVATSREMATLPGHLNEVWGAGFSPDGRRLATCGRNAQDAVKLWDLTTLREVLTLSGEGEYFMPVAFSPDGNTLTAASLAGIAHVWRAPSWAEIEAREKATGKQAPSRNLFPISPE